VPATSVVVAVAGQGQVKSIAMARLAARRGDGAESADCLTRLQPRGILRPSSNIVRGVPVGRSCKSSAHLDIARERLLYAATQLADGRGEPELRLDNDDVVREAGRALGAAAALAVDRYWRASTTAPSGPINVIDMFSGAGGMSAGFRVANGIAPLFRIAGAVDIDPVANRTFERNFGVTPLQADVSELARDPRALQSVMEACGHSPDTPLVLIGCAPCQGFSSHRNGAGEEDTRNSLFVDFARVAAMLKPAAVVIENVPELLTNRYWPYVREARRVLEAAGYMTYLGVHNMADYAVPQERFRALLLAFRKPFSAPRGFLDRSRYRTVREAIGHLPKIPPGGPYTEDPLHYTANHRESTLAVIRDVPRDGGSRPEDVGPVSLQRLARRQGKPGYEDIYGRLWWDRPAITITAYARNPASGRFVHPEQDRGLSVREAALLQGYPADYWFDGTLDQRFRQIGNAVPPPFAAYLAFHVAAELLALRPPAQPATRGIVRPVGKSFSRIIPAIKGGHLSEDGALGSTSRDRHD